MMKYILFALLSASSLMATEKYAIKEHASVIADKNNLLLCTVSGDKGVYCGIFSIEGNKTALLLSTYIKNEDIVTFSGAIKSLLSYFTDAYGLAIQYACFSGPGGW